MWNGKRLSPDWNQLIKYLWYIMLFTYWRVGALDVFCIIQARAGFQSMDFNIKWVVEIFVFLPDSTLPSETQDLKTLFVSTGDKIFCSEHTHQFEQTFAEFYKGELGGCYDDNFPVCRRVKLMVRGLLCCLTEQEGQQGHWKQHGGMSVLSPFWGKLGRGQLMRFTVECAGVFLNVVDGREQKRTLIFFWRKTSSRIFLIME